MKVEPERTHLLKEFKHDAPLLTCAFDPTGRFVFAGGRDRFVHRWEVATGNKISLEAHETWVCTMACAFVRSGDNHAITGSAEVEKASDAVAGSDQWSEPTADPNTNLITGDYAGRVVCWSLADDSPKVRWTTEAHQGTVRSVSVSPDGKLLATGGTDGKVRLWATDTGKPAGELSGHAGQVYCVAFHPSGRFLASGDRQSQHPTVRQWDLDNQRELSNLDASDLSAYRRGENVEWGGCRGLAFSSDGSILACCGRHKYAGPAAVLLFDHRTGKQTEKLISTFKAVFHRVILHPNGFLIAAGGAIKSGELWFWKPRDEESERDREEGTTTTDTEPIATINVAGPASCIDLHPNGRQIAVAQSLGKSSYPDGGAIGIYDMSPEESETEDGTRE